MIAICRCRTEYSHADIWEHEKTAQFSTREPLPVQHIIREPGQYQETGTYSHSEDEREQSFESADDEKHDRGGMSMDVMSVPVTKTQLMLAMRASMHMHDV